MMLSVVNLRLQIKPSCSLGLGWWGWEGKHNTFPWQSLCLVLEDGGESPIFRFALPCLCHNTIFRHHDQTTNKATLTQLTLSLLHTTHATTTGKQEAGGRYLAHRRLLLFCLRLCLCVCPPSTTTTPEPCPHHHSQPPHDDLVVPGLGPPSPPSPCSPCCLALSVPTALRTAGANVACSTSTRPACPSHLLLLLLEFKQPLQVLCLALPCQITWTSLPCSSTTATRRRQASLLLARTPAFVSMLGFPHHHHTETTTMPPSRYVCPPP